MIEFVCDDRSTWNVLPHKFEAGTPNVADAVGLAAACDYLDGIGMDGVLAHERTLVRLAMDALASRSTASASTVRRPQIGAASSASRSTTSIRTISRPSSTATASAFAPGTTARSR